MNPIPKAAGGSSVVPEIEGYETILASLQAGICRLDTNGRIVYLNDAAAEMLGREKDELLGSNYSEMFFGPGAGREDPRCGPFEFTLDEGEISHINTENLVREDGSEFLSELVCVPAEDSDGGNGAVVSFIDVTDRRSVEDAVSDARDKAVEAARSKAEFLANMSHEIRTPLTGILGTVDLLSGTDLKDEQREILSILRNSTELLQRVVNEILDFSKIEAGKFVTTSEVFSLGDLTESVVGAFRTLASNKKLNFTVEFAKQLPHFVECDAKCVQQVLNNLLSNALKFTEDGGVVLRVGTGSADNRLRFVVSDTGIGIPESEQEKLFVPFEQADTSDSRQFGGTGLGLAICRRLALLTGGEIGFDSQEGAGSQFWFEIPYKPASEPPVMAEITAVSDTNVQKPRILVVEDNPVNLEVTQRLLEQIGIIPVLAESGDKAVSECSKQDFDIVLMDCQMPGMDGYEAARRIKENGGTASIIAFTASVNENDRVKLAGSGMDGILLKPFTKADLIDVVEAHRQQQKTDKNLDLSRYFGEHSISKFIEPEKLKQFASLDTDPRGFFREILGVFADHFSEKLEDLKTAIEDSDRETIKSVAHNLKGSSANLGITKLYSLFQTMESNIGDADKLDELLHEITLEFGRVREAINELEKEENLK